MIRIRTLMISVAAASGAAAMAACGSSGGGSASGAPSTPASSSAAQGAAPQAAVIKAAAVGRLGTAVVDGKGMTLYLFAADSNKPPASHCDNACAKYWPPLLATTTVPAAHGVSASLLGTVARSDGTKQVTLNGWPLYTYVGDHAPGQANGEGLNASGGTWWALTATGQRSGAAGTSGSSSSGPSSSPSGSSGGGYGGY